MILEVIQKVALLLSDHSFVYESHLARDKTSFGPKTCEAISWIWFIWSLFIQNKLWMRFTNWRSNICDQHIVTDVHAKFVLIRAVSRQWLSTCYVHQIVVMDWPLLIIAFSNSTLNSSDSALNFKSSAFQSLICSSFFSWTLLSISFLSYDICFHI